MEGLALTGASVDRERGPALHDRAGDGRLVRSVRAAQARRAGHSDGPHRHADRDAGEETVLLVGGGLGNAVLFSIGQTLRDSGSRVVYFAGYKKIIDRYKVEEIEAAADVVVWCCDEAPGFTPDRAQDRVVRRQHRRRRWSRTPRRARRRPDPAQLGRPLIAIGSDGMMSAVATGPARRSAAVPEAGPSRDRQHQLADAVHDEGDLRAVPADAQGPSTGEETVVFSCFNQDQPLDHVDFANLRSRLSQNGVQEKLTKLWIDHCLREITARPAMIG